MQECTKTKMQECTKMRAGIHHRVGTITLKMTPPLKWKTRLTKQGTEMRPKMRMEMTLKIRTKMDMRTQTRTKFNRRT